MESVRGDTVEDVIDATTTAVPDCAEVAITVALAGAAGVTLLTTTFPSEIW
jgi:hypothetical protein